MRIPKQIPDTILVKYAKSRSNPDPDYWVSFGVGAGSGSANVALLAIRDLGNELEKRGYDLSTLRFSIKKKPKTIAGHNSEL